jgi:hypothetical protein
VYKSTLIRFEVFLAVYVQILVLWGDTGKYCNTRMRVNISDFISYQYSFLLCTAEGS